MKIHRFYIKDIIFTEKIILTKKDYPNTHNQMVNVLKLQKEELVTLFNSYSNNSTENKVEQSGFDYTYVIKGLGHKEVMLILKEKNENKIDKTLKDRPKINLYIANIKKDKLEWSVEKAVELGVSNIFLLDTERTQKQNIKINSTESSAERLNKITIEAGEQCGRGEVATTHETQDLSKILEDIKSGTDKISKDLNYACLIPKHSIDTAEHKEKMFHTQDIKSNINIFIGPEGGWTEKEEGLFESLALENKINILNLGPTILRAETAAICAISKFV